jgi:ribosomal protein S18 acetylase RimI-like enzyme
MTSKPVIRRASAGDAAALGELWLQSFKAALPSVCVVHTDDQVRRWIRDVVIERQETWVICVDGEIAGMLALQGDEIDQLYLAPQRRGQGLGDQLVAQAKSRRPRGLRLWTFQVNAAAVSFYRRHGFRETTRTDGSQNEEHEPDIRMEWDPATPAPQAATGANAPRRGRPPTS